MFGIAPRRLTLCPPQCERVVWGYLKVFLDIISSFKARHHIFLIQLLIHIDKWSLNMRK